MGKKLTYDFVKNEFEKRGYILLETEYINSRTKMKYQCLKHPDEKLEMKYNSLKSGYGCPHCGYDRVASANKLSFDFVKSEFEKRGYILIDTEYVNTSTKMKYICPNHPNEDLYIRYNSLKRGDGCRFCGAESSSMKRKLDFETVKQEFEKRNYTLLETEYVNSTTPMRYQCPYHPDEELYIAYSIMKYGVGCRHCQYDKISKDMTLDFSFVKNEFEQCGYKLIEEEYINSHTKMKFQCPFHPNDDLYISYTELKSGRGCRLCGIELRSQKQRLDFEVVEQEFMKRNYILLEDKYISNKTKMRYICSLHPNEDLSICYSKLKQGQGCPFCANLVSKFKGESKIHEFLQLNNITFKRQYWFKDCRNKNPLLFDFAIFDENDNLYYLIEYDGQLHYIAIDHFGGERALHETQQRDEIKTKYCKDNNIKLIRIPYWDFENIEIILEKII